MQTVIIDLVKNPDIKDLLSSMQPGDPVDLHTTIKALDDQTATLTVEEASEGKKVDEAEPPTVTDADQADEGSEASPTTGGADLAGGEEAAM